jgi:hypothetical protein
MGDVSKNNTTTGLVSSGSGQSVIKTVDIPASIYATDTLSPGNALSLNTATSLTYTRQANYTRTQLEAADKNYTTVMNELSEYWTRGETNTINYETAKLYAMNAERRWQLARDGLEEVTVQDKIAQSESIGYLVPSRDLLSVEENDLDLTGTGSDLSTTPDPQNLEDSLDGDILVTGSPIDQRVRFRPKVRGQNAATYELFGDQSSVLYRLNETNGVFFPFTPTIEMAHRANYSSMTPTHANTDYQVYTHSPAVQINISGQFSSQNLAEAQYTLAAMHFFRTVTKMRFGRQDTNAGLPPPVLVLSGYGSFMLNDLNVIITDFHMDLPQDVDYIEVDVNGNSAWVPSLTTFNVSCVVQQTPKVQRDEFKFDDFASGALFDGKRGWI